MSKIPDTFICYKEWAEFFTYLSVDQKAQMLDLIFNFAAYGECPDIEDVTVKAIFAPIRRSIETNTRKYLEKCEKYSENGKKGGAPYGNQNARKSSQISDGSNKQANPPYSFTSSYDYGTVIPCPDDAYAFVDDMLLSSATGAGTREGETMPDGNSPAFAPPTLEDVEEYVIQKNLDIDAEQFFCYYGSIGWVTSSGRPIKDWKAAVRNWAKREEQYQ